MNTNKYKVWCPYDGETEDDAQSIDAISSHDAAIEWARLDDAKGDYRIVSGGDDIGVCVRCPQGAVQVYRVSGEPVPHYYARRIREGV